MNQMSHTQRKVLIYELMRTSTGTNLARLMLIPPLLKTSFGAAVGDSNWTNHLPMQLYVSGKFSISKASHTFNIILSF
jgi:hypothetical protein